VAKGSNYTTKENPRYMTERMGQKCSLGGFGYIGPLIADVARTIKATQAPCCNSKKALITWK
jgi:hypothetical protein